MVGCFQCFNANAKSSSRSRWWPCRAPAKNSLSTPSIDVLPTDVLLEIFAYLDSPYALVRCAAACKLWRRLITDPSFLDRLHRQCRFVPAAFLGFYYVIPDGVRTTPKFIPIAPCPASAAARLDAFFDDTSFDGDQHLYAFRPSGCSNGRLLCCRWTEGNLPYGFVEYCVHDPLRRRCTLLPPLPSDDMFKPRHCVLLSGRGDSFRVVASFHSPDRHLAVRIYSSETGSWGPAVLSEERMLGHYVSDGSCTVIINGFLHWLDGKQIIRMDLDTARLSWLEPPPTNSTDTWMRRRAVGCTDDGRLCYFHIKGTRIRVWVRREKHGDGPVNWILHDVIELWKKFPPEVFVRLSRPCNRGIRWLEFVWFCQRSGTIFLSIWFALYSFNLKSSVLEKVHCIDWLRSFCPYELPWPPSFSSLDLGKDDTILDGEQNNV